MPFEYACQATVSDTNAGTKVYAMGIRLNTPYDCMVTPSAGFTEPAAAADSADGTVQYAAFYNYWNSIYNYYHVVKTKYIIYIRNTTNTTSPVALNAYLYKHGRDQPPLWDSDVAASSLACPHMYRLMHPDMEWKRIAPRS